MSLRSLFIFNSSKHNTKRHATLKFVGLTLVFLALIDMGISFLFAYPSDPRELHINRLQLYFDYGRSMEGRLRRATRADPEQTAPITLAGWYDPLVAGIGAGKPFGQRVTLYGNSQTVRLGDALQKSSSHYTARTIAGPGSTANWAYGAYLRDNREEQGQAVVLTVMPSNLPMIRTMAAMTWNTSFAMPYTADVFQIDGNELTRYKPPYESFADYIAIINNERRWREAKKSFSLYDPFYDQFLFEQSFLDHSSVVRLLRRGWAQRRDARIRARSLNRNGYDPKDPSVEIANAIVKQFAQSAREKGLVPVIYIVNSRGYGDTMYRALADTIIADGIPYVSTHKFVDPNDPRNYLPDAHFTDDNDLRLARALEAVLDRELRQSAKSRESARLDVKN